MQTTSLTTQAKEHVAIAAQTASGRSATTVYGGNQHSLRQTLVTLVAGRELKEHANPGEATVQVLSGHVRLGSGEQSWEGHAGDLLVVPDAPHNLAAIEDSAVLLTVAARPMSSPDEASVSAIHEQHRHLVEAATLAPSVHNTQPWRFSSDGDILDLWLDQDRQLSYVDRDGRQALLSCGAALVHARVAARACGLDVETELLPDEADRTHLARLRLTQGRPAQSDEVTLAEAILRRHTFREAFEERPVPPALLQALRDDAESEGASIMILSDPDVLLEFEVLLSQADRGEELDPAYREELAAWVGGERTDDGIPTAALPGDPERGSSLRLRDFALRGAAGDHVDPPAPERPTVVVLSSVDDAPLSWLQAGQALGAVLLRAAQAGVQAQPLGQVTDSVGYRWRLGVLLGLINTPQLALRVGYGHAVASTPRRAVDDVLVDRGQLPEQR